MERDSYISFQLVVAAIGYYCFRSIPSKYFVWYIWTFIVAGVIQTVYSLFMQGEYFLLSEKWSRIYGAFLNPSVWGGFLALLMVMVTGMFLEKQVHKRKWILFVLWGTIGCLLWQSDSRGGWLTACVGMIGMGAIRRKTNYYRHSLIISFVLVFLLLFCYSLYIYKVDSGNGRLLIWRVSCEMINDAPWLGNGIEGFRQNYMLYQAMFFEKYPDHVWKLLADDNCFAFNEYIKIIVEHGILFGFTFFILLFFVFLRKIKPMNRRAKFSKYVLLSWGCFAFFSYPFLFWQFVIILLFFLAGLGGGEILKFSCEKKVPAKALCGIIPLLIISITLWLVPYLGKVCCWSSIVATKGTMVDKVHKIQYLLPSLGMVPSFLYGYGMKLYSVGDEAGANKILKCSFSFYPDYETALRIGKICSDQKEVAMAEYYLKMACKMIPYRVMPHYYLFQLYRDIGNKEKARLEVQRIKAMPVKVHSSHLNLIYIEIGLLEE